MIVRLVRFATERRVFITDAIGMLLAIENAPDAVLDDMNGDLIAYFDAKRTGGGWSIGARIEDQGW